MSEDTPTAAAAAAPGSAAPPPPPTPPPVKVERLVGTEEKVVEGTAPGQGQAH